MKKLPLMTLIASIILSTAALASAEEPIDTVPTESKAPGPSDLHAAGGLGAGSDDTLHGTVVGSASVGYRYEFVEAGVTGDSGSEIFGGSYAMGAIFASAVYQSAAGPRVSLGGMLGEDNYTHVHCGMFCRSGGASGSMPYAGARLSVSYVFRSRSRAHLELGVTGYWGRDLERERVSYSTTGSLFDSNTVNTNTTTLGGEHKGLLATVGVTFDTSEQR